MATAAEPYRSGSTECWCCANWYEEQQLTRLGSHPEVGICATCARWLARRARAGADAHRAGLGALARRRLDAARGWVMRVGLQDWPVVGRWLRHLDRHLP